MALGGSSPGTGRVGVESEGGTHRKDTLAERSKAVAQGAIPKGRGFEPHGCHFLRSRSCWGCAVWALATKEEEEEEEEEGKEKEEEEEEDKPM